jgi:1-acyl-sn-glycerol-3-phosphate acyltransferase
MSDERSPNGTSGPIEIEQEQSKPRRTRVKAAVSQDAGIQENGETETPVTSDRLPPSSLPPFPTSPDEESEPSAPLSSPTPVAFWGNDASHTALTATSTADSLYEVELEIRNRAERDPSPSADLGALAAGALQLVGENLRHMTAQQAARVRELLRGTDLSDYLDPAFWQGIGMVLGYQLDETTALLKRRLHGEYTTDPYGMDREAIEMVRPFLRFMYRTWWRVTPDGLEHVPAEGRALLVANHSGVLPWDGAMIAAAVAEDHPAQNDRIVRSLHLHWFTTLPFIAPALAAMGQVPGLPENAVRLLESDELVAVFPEGLKGVGKLFKDRYKLARFGRGGFVQVALRAQAPIVPVAVVGAEEIYPMLANAEPVAKLFGFPYFPLTPFFPWLGPLGVIPLPTRWSISFCEPIRTDEYDPAAADDPLTVLGLTEIVRERIQATLDAKIAVRRSIF